MGLEVGPEPRQAAPPSFYRLPMAGGVTSPGGGDCYYLVLRDQQRTSRLVHQLVDTLQQQVQSRARHTTSGCGNMLGQYSCYSRYQF